MLTDYGYYDFTVTESELGSSRLRGTPVIILKLETDTGYPVYKRIAVLEITKDTLKRFNLDYYNIKPSDALGLKLRLKVVPEYFQNRKYLVIP